MMVDVMAYGGHASVQVLHVKASNSLDAANIASQMLILGRGNNEKVTVKHKADSEFYYEYTVEGDFECTLRVYDPRSMRLSYVLAGAVHMMEELGHR